MNLDIPALTMYTEFNGTSNLSNWYFVLFNILISIVIYFVDNSIKSFGFQSIFYSLAILNPENAIGIIRLKDICRSGWNLLLALITFIGTVSSCTFLQESTCSENEFGLYPKQIKSAHSIYNILKREKHSISIL